MRDLFIARKQRHFTQLLKYWRLVFNDHFIIALFFLFGALAYRYAQWLPTVTPAAWWVWPVMLVWLTLVTQAGQLATLVQPADPVVLLPQTSAAQGYFRAAFYYSAWRGILLSEAGPFAAGQRSQCQCLAVVRGRAGRGRSGFEMGLVEICLPAAELPTAGRGLVAMGSPPGGLELEFGLAPGWAGLWAGVLAVQKASPST